MKMILTQKEKNFYHEKLRSLAVKMSYHLKKYEAFSKERTDMKKQYRTKLGVD